MMTDNSDLGQISRATAGAGQDGILAGGLMTAATWAPWLAEFNEVLTALSLMIGLLLASARLWLLFRENNKKRR
jgi:hypothetical protein